MSVEKLYGTWDTPRTDVNHLDRELQILWHELAAQHVGTPEFQPNSGLSQRKNEVIELWKLFHFQQPKIILEIGTAQGGTLAGWCRLAPTDATIIFIDRCVNDCRPKPGDPVHPSVSTRSHAVTEDGGGAHYLARGHQRIIPINGWSYDPAVMNMLLAALDGRKIDFLYHDASHSKEMFARDFKLYWPLVAEGGIFATHDVMHSNALECDKSVEWGRIRKEEEYSACYEYFSSRGHDSMGNGVLIK